MNRKLKVAACCLFLLLLFLVATDPRTLPSFLLVLPFIVIFGVVLLVLLHATAGVTAQAAKSNKRLALLGATLPSLLLALRSLGQLTIRDTLTMLAFFGVAYFYLGRATSPSGN